MIFMILKTFEQLKPRSKHLSQYSLGLPERQFSIVCRRKIVQDSFLLGLDKFFLGIRYRFSNAGSFVGGRATFWSLVAALTSTISIVHDSDLLSLDNIGKTKI